MLWRLIPWHWYPRSLGLNSEGRVGPRILSLESSLLVPLPNARASPLNKRFLLPSPLCSFSSNFPRIHRPAVLHSMYLHALAHVILIIHEAGTILTSQRKKLRLPAMTWALPGLSRAVTIGAGIWTQCSWHLSERRSRSAVLKRITQSSTRAAATAGSICNSTRSKLGRNGCILWASVCPLDLPWQ